MHKVWLCLEKEIIWSLWWGEVKEFISFLMVGLVKHYYYYYFAFLGSLMVCISKGKKKKIKTLEPLELILDVSVFSKSKIANLLA